MDKKGAGWKTIIVIVIILVSFAVILGWLLFYKEHLTGVAETIKERLLEAFRS